MGPDGDKWAWANLDGERRFVRREHPPLPVMRSGEFSLSDYSNLRERVKAQQKANVDLMKMLARLTHATNGTVTGASGTVDEIDGSFSSPPSSPPISGHIRRDPALSPQQAWMSSENPVMSAGLPVTNFSKSPDRPPERATLSAMRTRNPPPKRSFARPQTARISGSQQFGTKLDNISDDDRLSLKDVSLLASSRSRTSRARQPQHSTSPENSTSRPGGILSHSRSGVKSFNRILSSEEGSGVTYGISSDIGARRPVSRHLSHTSDLRNIRSPTAKSERTRLKEGMRRSTRTCALSGLRWAHPLPEYSFRRAYLIWLSTYPDFRVIVRFVGGGEPYIAGVVVRRSHKRGLGDSCGHGPADHVEGELRNSLVAATTYFQMWGIRLLSLSFWRLRMVVWRARRVRTLQRHHDQIQIRLLFGGWKTQAVAGRRRRFAESWMKRKRLQRTFNKLWEYHVWCGKKQQLYTAAQVYHREKALSLSWNAWYEFTDNALHERQQLTAAQKLCALNRKTKSFAALLHHYRTEVGARRRLAAANRYYEMNAYRACLRKWIEFVELERKLIALSERAEMVRARRMGVRILKEWRFIMVKCRHLRGCEEEVLRRRCRRMKLKCVLYWQEYTTEMRQEAHKMEEADRLWVRRARGRYFRTWRVSSRWRKRIRVVYEKATNKALARQKSAVLLAWHETTRQMVAEFDATVKSMLRLWLSFARVSRIHRAHSLRTATRAWRAIARKLSYLARLSVEVATNRQSKLQRLAWHGWASMCLAAQFRRYQMIRLGFAFLHAYREYRRWKKRALSDADEHYVCSLLTRGFSGLTAPTSSAQDLARAAELASEYYTRRLLSCVVKEWLDEAVVYAPMIADAVRRRAWRGWMQYRHLVRTARLILKEAFARGRLAVLAHAFVTWHRTCEARNNFRRLLAKADQYNSYRLGRTKQLVLRYLDMNARAEQFRKNHLREMVIHRFVCEARALARLTHVMKSILLPMFEYTRALRVLRAWRKHVFVVRRIESFLVSHHYRLREYAFAGLVSHLRHCRHAWRRAMEHGNARALRRAWGDWLEGIDACKMEEKARLHVLRRYWVSWAIAISEGLLLDDDENDDDDGDDDIPLHDYNDPTSDDTCAPGGANAGHAYNRPSTPRSAGSTSIVDAGEPATPKRELSRGTSMGGVGGSAGDPGGVDVGAILLRLKEMEAGKPVFKYNAKKAQRVARQLRVDIGKGLLLWGSKSHSVSLSSIDGVVYGPLSDVFKQYYEKHKQQLPDHPSLCFSVHTTAGRTFDFACKAEQDVQVFVLGLQGLMKDAAGKPVNTEDEVKAACAQMKVDAAQGIFPPRNALATAAAGTHPPTGASKSSVKTVSFSSVSYFPEGSDKIVDGDVVDEEDASGMGADLRPNSTATSGVARSVGVDVASSVTDVPASSVVREAASDVPTEAALASDVKPSVSAKPAPLSVVIPSTPASYGHGHSQGGPLHPKSPLQSPPIVPPAASVTETATVADESAPEESLAPKPRPGGISREVAKDLTVETDFENPATSLSARVRLLHGECEVGVEDTCPAVPVLTGGEACILTLSIGADSLTWHCVNARGMRDEILIERILRMERDMFSDPSSEGGSEVGELSVGNLVIITDGGAREVCFGFTSHEMLEHWAHGLAELLRRAGKEDAIPPELIPVSVRRVTVQQSPKQGIPSPTLLKHSSAQGVPAAVHVSCSPRGAPGTSPRGAPRSPYSPSMRKQHNKIPILFSTSAVMSEEKKDETTQSNTGKRSLYRTSSAPSERALSPPLDSDQGRTQSVETVEKTGSLRRVTDVAASIERSNEFDDDGIEDIEVLDASFEVSPPRPSKVVAGTSLLSQGDRSSATMFLQDPSPPTPETDAVMAVESFSPSSPADTIQTGLSNPPGPAARSIQRTITDDDLFGDDDDDDIDDLGFGFDSFKQAESESKPEPEQPVATGASGVGISGASDAAVVSRGNGTPQEDSSGQGAVAEEATSLAEPAKKKTPKKGKPFAMFRSMLSPARSNTPSAQGDDSDCGNRTVHRSHTGTSLPAGNEALRSGTVVGMEGESLSLETKSSSGLFSIFKKKSTKKDPHGDADAQRNRAAHAHPVEEPVATSSQSLEPMTSPQPTAGGKVSGTDTDSLLDADLAAGGSVREDDVEEFGSVHSFGSDGLVFGDPKPTTRALCSEPFMAVKSPLRNAPPGAGAGAGATNYDDWDSDVSSLQDVAPTRDESDRGSSGIVTGGTQTPVDACTPVAMIPTTPMTPFDAPSTSTLEPPVPRSGEGREMAADTGREMTSVGSDDEDGRYARLADEEEQGRRKGSDGAVESQRAGPGGDGAGTLRRLSGGETALEATPARASDTPHQPSAHETTEPVHPTGDSNAKKKGIFSRLFGGKSKNKDKEKKSKKEKKGAKDKEKEEDDSSKEHVFGAPIHTVLERQRRSVRFGSMSVPYVVQSLIEALDQKHMETEGLFRTVGSSSHVQTLRGKFDTPDSNAWPAVQDLSSEDAETLCSTLKKYLTDIPGNLLGKDTYAQCIQCVRSLPNQGKDTSNPTPAAIAQFRAAIDQLPSEKGSLMQVLFPFLQRVARHSALNRMTASNLAVVFAANLFSDDTLSADPLEMEAQQTFIRFLIEHAHRLWADQGPSAEDEQKKSAPTRGTAAQLTSIGMAADDDDDDDDVHPFVSGVLKPSASGVGAEDDGDVVAIGGGGGGGGGVGTTAPAAMDKWDSLDSMDGQDAAPAARLAIGAGASHSAAQAASSTMNDDDDKGSVTSLGTFRSEVSTTATSVMSTASASTAKKGMFGFLKKRKVGKILKKSKPGVTFGVPLEDILARERGLAPGLGSAGELPCAFEVLAGALEKCGLSTPELFSRTDKSKYYKGMKKRLDVADPKALPSVRAVAAEVPPLALATLLQRFVKDIPGGLIKQQNFNVCIAAVDLLDEKADVEFSVYTFRACVASLPIPTFNLLRRICGLLSKVAMTPAASTNARALATLWSPVIFSGVHTSATLDDRVKFEFCRLCIEHADAIFSNLEQSTRRASAASETGAAAATATATATETDSATATEVAGESALSLAEKLGAYMPSGKHDAGHGADADSEGESDDSRGGGVGPSVVAGPGSTKPESTSVIPAAHEKTTPPPTTLKRASKSNGGAVSSSAAPATKKKGLFGLFKKGKAEPSVDGGETKKLFGEPLESLLADEAVESGETVQVPSLVRVLTASIERECRSQHAVGLFRAHPKPKKIKALQAQFESADVGARPTVESLQSSGESPTTQAALLMKFVKEVPGGLVPDAAVTKVNSVVDILDDDDSDVDCNPQAFRGIVSALPPANAAILVELFSLLAAVAPHFKETGTSDSDLASEAQEAIFAHCKPPKTKKAGRERFEFCRLFITHFDQIYPNHATGL